MRNNSSDKRNRFNYDPEKEKQKLKVLKEEKIKKDLDIDSFPEMIPTTKKILNNENNGNNGNNEISKNENVISLNEKPSFLDKLNIVKEVQKEEECEFVKDGCVTIRLVGRKIEYKYGKMNNVQDNDTKPSPHNVMTHLVRLHESRKAEYIRKWGEEDYDNTFSFKNYDSEYFDKLDDIYEREMEEFELEMESEGIDSEYEYY